MSFSLCLIGKVSSRFFFRKTQHPDTTAKMVRTLGPKRNPELHDFFLEKSHPVSVIPVNRTKKQKYTYFTMSMLNWQKFSKKRASDAGSRTPVCSVKANRASRYTTSDCSCLIHLEKLPVILFGVT